MTKDKKIILNILQIFIIILLYYLVGKNSIFLYVLSLSLYQIFISSFSHLSFKNSFDKYQDIKEKNTFLNISIFSISCLSLAFIILSILISDISSTILKIEDMFLVFLFMGLSIISTPLKNLYLDYLNSTKRIKKANIIDNLYSYSEIILFIILSILLFKVLDIPLHIKNALLYLPKILSILLSSIAFFLITKKDYSKATIKIFKNTNKYYRELKKVLTKDNYKSIINIVKNSYYYISIIILYLVLSTRYKYAINVIEEDITFIYYYLLMIIISLSKIIVPSINNSESSKTLTNKLYLRLKIILPISIILSIISPLICKIIFNAPDKSIYLVIINFMILFLSLYNTTINELKNKKLLYVCISIGIITKLLTTIPLINAFYRMGYNLIYGDIVSTMISLLIPTIIGYMSSSNKSSKGEKYLDKILNIFYENIILTIILIVLEFIIPITTNSYLKSILLVMLYLSISYAFFKIKNKYYNE